jgi:hypothetical protein
MLKKLRLLFLFSLVSFSVANAQIGQGGIKGKVLDKSNNESIPFANVIVELNGVQVGGATTDFDGNYHIKPLSPGKYDVKASFVGYQQVMISGFIVRSDKTEFLNIAMSQGIELKAFEKIEYTVPLISKDNTSSGGTVTRDEIARMPGRSADMVAITVGGIFSEDGERGNVRGARSEATDTYIDGVKVRGSTSLPNQAIEQVTVIMGGVPAQYGDATGGIISITTRGASSRYGGGLEFLSSQITDPYKSNLLGYTLTGPLLFKKNQNESAVKKPLVGFFLAGELNSVRDPRPSPVGSFRVNDSTMNFLRENPLRVAPGGQGVFMNSDFLRRDQIESIKARQNVEARGMLIQSKFDFNLSDNTFLSLGGNLDFNRDRGNGINNMLLNSENNPYLTDKTWRVYANFTQRFGSGKDDAASVIKGAYYTLQADYSKFDSKSEDPRHRNNVFQHGHIGYFESVFEPNYQFTFNDSLGLLGYYQDNFRQTQYNFTPGPHNPYLANYTNFYYDLHKDSPEGFLENPQQVLEGGGLTNGLYPRSVGSGHVYDLWNAPGMPFNSYAITDNSQFRIRATGGADIKNHSLLIGFEYEQRSDRAFSVSPYGLWRHMRQLTNNHILELDKNNPIIDYFNGTYPIISYNRLNSSPGEYDKNNPNETQYFFDYNLRNALNLPTDGTDFIDVDNIDPSKFKLDFFSADELLNNGNSYVSYFGYNHAGERSRRNPSFEDFFSRRDDYGNLTREVQPFQPIYIAGYIQDKFSFDDLVFNVGLRVDRFDANQKVLKDPYSLFETRKASELPEGFKPTNMGDDYVVYVNDVKTENISERGTVVGYRNGSTWYNAQGVEINDPSVLVTSSGNVAPWLVDPANTQPSTHLKSSAFKDYEPQVIVMPRIAFSFPISDEALFYAHYDVLAKRPGAGLRFDPTDYLFIMNGGGLLNNPNLKPEKTITYELGFQQRLTPSSSLKLSAFYNENRNQIQAINVNYAFPRSYFTYGNIDFSTVKGMTLAYDLRRTGNASLRATYTLQFADGTGSNAQTGFNMINAGQPNLRTIFPLDYDQRHNFTTNFDYRYGSGKNYNGPILFDRQILANTGINIMTLAGSGAPYSEQLIVTGDALTNGGRSLMKGSLNGSRKPWRFTANFRLDRDIDLAWGKEDKRKTASLNVYVLVQNALNNRNVISVYRFTGNPDDDGYLSAPEMQAGISSQNDEQAFRELYALKLMNPFNFSTPRTIRLGVILNF